MDKLEKLARILEAPGTGAVWQHLTPRAEETRGGSGISVLLMAGKSQEELLFQGLQVPKRYPDLSFPLPSELLKMFPRG